MAECDPAFLEVVRRHRHSDPVVQDHSNLILSNTTADVGSHSSAPFSGHFEDASRPHVCHRTFYFNQVVGSHHISAPTLHRVG